MSHHKTVIAEACEVDIDSFDIKYLVIVPSPIRMGASLMLAKIVDEETDSGEYVAVEADEDGKARVDSCWGDDSWDCFDDFCGHYEVYLIQTP